MNVLRSALLIAAATLLAPTALVAQQADGVDPDESPFDDTDQEAPRRGQPRRQARNQPVEATVLDDALATASSRFRWSGEQVSYTIQILGDEVARTGFAIGFPEEREGYGTVIPVTGGATSVGFFALVYSMNDTAETLISPETGLPVFTTKTIDERDQVRTYEVTYLPDAYRAEVARIRSERTDEYARLTPSDLHDALSWFMDLRSRDLSVGNEYVYFVYDGWKLSRLTARVTQHLDVYTPIGFIPSAELSFTREVLSSSPALPWADTYYTLPPVYVVTDGPQDLGVGWFSLDERCLPVGTEIETPLGRLRVLVDGHQPPP